MEFGFSKRNLKKFEVEKGFYSKKTGIMIPSWKKMEFCFFRSGICKNLKWKITAPTIDRNHDIVRGRLNRFLSPNIRLSLGVRKISFGGSGYYTHNTQGYLDRPESLVIPYQDKSFLQ